MTTGRKIALALSLAATTLAGGAYAQQTFQKADRDAPITRAQAQARAQERFARMDVNKDGKVDQADRAARRAERQTAAFTRMDTDKNGQISRAEFDAAGPGMRGDHDGRGKHGWGGRGGHEGRGEGRGGDWGRGPGGGRGGDGAGLADANKDGALTQAEFTAAALQRFDRADANKDGTVTAAERQTAREAMRDEMRQRWQAERAAQPAAAKTN